MGYGLANNHVYYSIESVFNLSNLLVKNLSSFIFLVVSDTCVAVECACLFQVRKC